MTNPTEDQKRPSSSANDLEDNKTAGEDVSQPHGRVKVVKLGHERSIRLLLVVENFRLAFYLTFLFVIFLGIILTISFVEVDYKAGIVKVFGVVNICVYFDYPPSTYILPSIYSLGTLFIHSYGIVSIFRVWVAMEEGKVSKASFIGYVIGFVYVLLSVVFFITVFAVQPHEENLAVTWRIHSAPYTNLVVAVWVLAVLITWFGDKVAWKDLGIPRALFIINWVMVACQSITVPAHIIYHLNCLGDVDNGLWWDPSTAPKTTIVFQVLSYVFLATTVLWPTLQSAYLSYKGHTTHCVYLSLEDNRKARTNLIDKN